MKNKLLITAITSIALVLCSCGKNNDESVSTTVAETTTVQETTQAQATTKVPDNVQYIYDKYKDVIKTNSSDYTLSNINIFNNSSGGICYSFEISQIDSSYATVKFDFENKQQTDSYTIDFSDDFNNKSQKEIIKYTMEVLNSSYTNEQIENATKVLVNSYDGTKNSDVYKTDNYAIFLEGSHGVPLFDTRLRIINSNQINSAVDTSLYNDFSSEEIQAVMNKGELCHLRATVVENYESEFNYFLEAIADNKKYIIAYNYSCFPDFFEIGKEYDFYGNIAVNRDNYDGAIRIDYCQPVN